jgi:hypothetical protein
MLTAAERIYRLELTSSEVRADRNEVQNYQPLLSALASGDITGVEQAVTKLVYSGTHVVRLRVVRAGHVLADVGGPYIIAPVSGGIRAGGHTLATYVLSVQDDLGYVKLETRYIGVPMLLRRGATRIPLEGEIPAGSPRIPTSGEVSYRGGSFQAVSFTAQAFPSGPLTVTLLVPMPASSLGCGAVRLLEAGRIAQTMWRRYMLVSASPAQYVKGAHELTGALVYVRSPSGQIAGSTGAGPSRLPDSGTVSYHGRTYRVTSFPSSTASGQVRVYVLLAS